MKYVIDIPQSYYEQIQEYPQQIWIGRDIIKPLQTELEEIKKSIERNLEQYRLTDLYSPHFDLMVKTSDVMNIIDNHIKERQE